MVLGVLFGSIEFDGSMVWEWDQETCTMLNNLGYISLQWFCIETTVLQAYNGSQAAWVLWVYTSEQIDERHFARAIYIQFPKKA